jgi:hypothetical protein
MALWSIAASVHAGRRNFNDTPRRSSDGVWQKGYGPLGYGWYNVYGDYVGYDGYRAMGIGTRGYPGRSPACFGPGLPGTGFDRTSSYGNQ